MAYEIRYDSDGDFLQCRMSGELNVKDLRGYGQEVAAQLKKHNCSRLVNDTRGVDLKLSTVDIYEIPRIFLNAGINKFVKRAVIVSPDFKDARFFETVSVNQGQNLKVFTDFDEAVSWIKE